MGKLRRKQKKPKVNPMELKYQKYDAAIEKVKKLSDDCFFEVFKSMQMSSFYVLYYNMDFSKQQIKNYNEILRRNNNEYREKADNTIDLENQIKKNIGFDCEVEAHNVPYAVKTKMFGRKIMPYEAPLLVGNMNDAIESYLIIAVHTLHKNYRFSGDMIVEWWEKLLDFLQLYVGGLNDDHIVKYFKQECDLSIAGVEE